MNTAAIDYSIGRPLPSDGTAKVQFSARPDPAHEARSLASLRRCIRAAATVSGMLLTVAGGGLALSAPAPAGLSSSVAVQPQREEWRDALKRQIAAYAELQPDWDLSGGLTPSAISIDNALRFIDILPPTHVEASTMVEGDGSVGFYWKAPNIFIDITFGEDGLICYYGGHKVNNQLIEAKGMARFDGDAVPSDLAYLIGTI